MNNFAFLNPVLGTCLMILLIFADYVRKYNTNDFQRGLFLIVLGAGFVAAVADFMTRTLGDTGTSSLLYGTATVFLLSQNVTYYMSIVFIDYFVYNNPRRTKKFITWIAVFLCIQGITLLFNLSYHFFFYIADNRYTPGPYYFLRLAISYLPIPICMVDMFISSKLIPRTQRYLIIFFALLTGSGAAMDIVIRTGNLTWPCFAGALLYLYFFIVQADSRLDGLTGIGNRYAFNEFIEKLSRQNKPEAPVRNRERSGESRKPSFRNLFSRKGPMKESWSIVMIDMDHFKRINDTLGHAEGDNALRDMVGIIKSCIRHSDFAARYGGDEFVLAVRTESDVEKLMDRIKEAIEYHNQKNARPYKLEISYGYDIFTTNSGQSINEFLNHIDGLMYKNKEERRRKTDRPEESRPGEKQLPENRSEAEYV
ncbi:MAG: diguanylate cyclase [Treponema sp.]|jgi:diguanylate cyclase (GGDEF)-like protein|nr:diguanylate cyclase [Treponema sp.]